MTAATAAPAAPMSSNAASATCAACGFGVSFTVISVVTARRPSEPLTSASRSYPALSSASPPNSTISPVISTPRTRRTLCTVSPYLRQWTPPAFSATLPPIEQAICDDGSGA